MKLYNKILKEALDIMDFSSWDDSEQTFKDDIKKSLHSLLTYKLNFYQEIKIFGSNISVYKQFKDKVYINDERVQLENGFTVNVYEPGEYRVYIEDFDKLEYFESYIFSDCNELSSITIPDSVARIGRNAFSNCSSLTSVTIPNSVTAIPWKCFYYCKNLTSVTIPASVTFIDEDAFIGCKNLKKVYIEDIEKFKQIEFETSYSNPTYYGAKLIELKQGLNEALDIMDFDSWDNNEQTFKEIIEDNLKNVFIYGLHYVSDGIRKYATMPRIFGSTWPALAKYKDNVFLKSGKKLNIIYTDEPYPDFPKAMIGLCDPKDPKYWGINSEDTNEIEVIIENLDGIKDCRTMFEECTTLKKVPMFDTSKCTSMYKMFNDCHDLETVPKLNKNSLPVWDYNWKSYMFLCCWNLDEQTKRDWYIE